jgi:hypothetical protein
VGVDKPAIRAARTFKPTRFFAAPASWQEFKEVGTQSTFDLLINICVPPSAARTIISRKFLR